ncbi:hypothetical protein DESUT3_37010 [Desulfuromonas versatilis]|uniref:Flagellar hook-length control protein-like C-terminal domain-containing protein n=1 Tax=Desulfuromonas versatilis TaxID=2802975 RepID=A0ABM8I193_9BACT|nr:flagellar hook-length control protein FliK [Desulfuromonas versatilis]BCR06632.1 hypothetical protein DESUT3_37010 [Desulfuromonas versatilis]
MQMMAINLEGLLPMAPQGQAKGPSAAGGGAFLEQLQAVLTAQGNGSPKGMEALLAMFGGQQAVTGLPMPELANLGEEFSAELPQQLAELLEQLEELPAGALQVAGMVQPLSAETLPQGDMAAETVSLKSVVAQPVPVAGAEAVPEAQAAQPEVPVVEGKALAEAASTQKPAAAAVSQVPSSDVQISQASQVAVGKPAPAEETREGKAKESLSDNRFAQMLGLHKGATAAVSPQAEVRPAAEAQQAPIALNAEASAEAVVAEKLVATEASPEAAPAKSAQGFEQQLAQVSRAGEPPQPAEAAAQGPAVKLPSGQLVPESQILGQLASRITLNHTEKQSRMTLNLHPEELGQVKLELVMEKDGLRAHLQAQNPQVQEVLERHLPRLREALAQQGLRLDDLQVSVDSQDRGDQGFFQQHQQQSAFGRRPSYSFGSSAAAVQAEEVSATAGQTQSRQGLSLRI